MKITIDIDDGDDGARAVAAVRAAAASLASYDSRLGVVAKGLWKSETAALSEGSIVAFRGLQIRIENPTGSVRKWTDESGREGQTTMKVPYGEILGAPGADGDLYDCFLGPDPTAPFVYVVDQARPDLPNGHPLSIFDEQKALLGFSSPAEAMATFLEHYDDPRFLGSFTQLTFEEFSEKIRSLSSDGIVKSSTVSARPTGALVITKASMHDAQDTTTGTGQNFVSGVPHEPQDTSRTAVRELLEATAEETPNPLYRDPEVYSDLRPNGPIPLRDVASWLDVDRASRVKNEYTKDLRVFIESRAAKHVEATRALPIKILETWEGSKP